MNVRRTWRRTPTAGARPSTGAPPAMPATPSARSIRKRIEEGFGWIKTVAGQRKTRFRGKDRVGWAFTFAAAAYNLVRLPKLLAAAHERSQGKWRIVEAELWDRAYLDLCRAGDAIVIGANGRGEIAFGAMQATLDVEYGPHLDRLHAGSASTKWTKSPAKGTPNCSTTAPSRSNSNTTTATRPSSKRSETVLQRDGFSTACYASARRDWLDPERGAVQSEGLDGLALRGVCRNFASGTVVYRPFRLASRAGFLGCAVGRPFGTGCGVGLMSLRRSLRLLGFAPSLGVDPFANAVELDRALGWRRVQARLIGRALVLGRARVAGPTGASASLTTGFSPPSVTVACCASISARSSRMRSCNSGFVIL